MFGPVIITREMQDVLDAWHLDLESELNQREDRFNIAPTMKSPVIALHDEKPMVEAMRWGLVPSWSKDLKIGAKTINARAETVQTKPAFRSAFKTKRCLVPASGYFEWQGETPHKQPYFIKDPAGRLLLFAGLWEAWKPHDAEEWLHTYTVITGQPGKVSGNIHDRQPVILQPDAWDAWLCAEPDDARKLLEQAPEADLTYYPVSKAVGTPKNQGAELVEPITP